MSIFDYVLRILRLLLVLVNSYKHDVDAKSDDESTYLTFGLFLILFNDDIVCFSLKLLGRSNSIRLELL